MTNLQATPGWDDIYQLEVTDPAQGGPGGVLNRQAQALLNRAAYLQEQLQGVIQTLTGKAPLVHQHDASALVSGVLDPARIPVLPSQATVVSSGGLAALTAAQQAEIIQGVVVTTTDGWRWVYTGSGDKTAQASYIQLADITPDWTAIQNKPGQFPPSPHGHAIADVAGLQQELDTLAAGASNPLGSWLRAVVGNPNGTVNLSAAAHARLITYFFNLQPDGTLVCVRPCSLSLSISGRANGNSGGNQAVWDLWVKILKNGAELASQYAEVGTNVGLDSWLTAAVSVPADFQAGDVLAFQLLHGGNGSNSSVATCSVLLLPGMSLPAPIAPSLTWTTPASLAFSVANTEPTPYVLSWPLGAAGGTAPYTFSWIASTLTNPSISGTTFTGQAASGGSFTTTLRVTDAEGHTADLTIGTTITVTTSGGGGGGGGGGCFAPWTWILMADGAPKPIEAIRPGDRIRTFTEGMEGPVEARVEALHDHEGRYSVLELEGILATPEHPWALAEGRFLPTGALKEGDSLMALDDQGTALAPTPMTAAPRRAGTLPRVLNLSTTARTFQVAARPEGPFFLVHNMKAQTL
ncbi:MAG: hypothetical protein HYZ13_04195 [Acidobacteria bacterium]|nr:hypothetical protein [Acidobacteriota bacterium]